MMRSCGISVGYSCCNAAHGCAQAYADYEDVMKLSEDLLSSMVLELKGSYKIQYHAVSCR